MWVSHETIYRFVREALANGIPYAEHLRRGNLLHPRAPRGKNPYKHIRNTRSIEERPVEAQDRLELGYFESDTLKVLLSNPYGLATHVDCKTLETIFSYFIKHENFSARLSPGPENGRISPMRSARRWPRRGAGCRPPPVRRRGFFPRADGGLGSVCGAGRRD